MIGVDRRKRARFEATSKQVDNDNNIPSGFTCPLTMEAMFDPVLDAEGNTYERSALLQWLTNNRTSPISRQPLNERMIISNNALRDTIHEFMGADWVKEQRTRQTKTTTPPSAPRAKIDCYLQNTCRELGILDLKLNNEGCCAFRYDNITIILDVPDKVGVFCLYTKDLVKADHLPKDQLYRRALELNFLQGDTRGGCLSIRKQDEILFSYTDRVPEVSARDFSNILLNFVETAVSLRGKLMENNQESRQEIAPPNPETEWEVSDELEDLDASERSEQSQSDTDKANTTTTNSSNYSTNDNAVADAPPHL